MRRIYFGCSGLLPLIPRSSHLCNPKYLSNMKGNLQLHNLLYFYFTKTPQLDLLTYFGLSSLLPLAPRGSRLSVTPNHPEFQFIISNPSTLLSKKNSWKPHNWIIVEPTLVFRVCCRWLPEVLAFA